MSKLTEIKNIETWDDYRIKMFQLITNKINNSRNSQYIISGWNHIDTKLVLIYDDCAEVIEYKYWPHLKTMKIEIYWCKDWENRGDGHTVTKKVDNILETLERE